MYHPTLSTDRSSGLLHTDKMNIIKYKLVTLKVESVKFLIVFNIFPLAGEQNDSPKRPPEAFCYRAKRSLTSECLGFQHGAEPGHPPLSLAVLELKCDVHER
ncbi:conserved hypothetical protein [Trichinella spiralis]|uniref:hypothetical protein n=1 Tax=Trichinella spiralis TaxID=6334 RepID=UPI0001EFC05C|nr:conserved hypothetical protein [Trichinella spiralis]